MSSAARYGIVTPVLTLLPRAHARWERDAGIDEVAEVVRAADRLGYSHITCSEHVAVPASAAAIRGTTYWDPGATLGYLAACTERIRLATHVLVLGYHHPLEIAKRYGTLDRLSRGRLILGVGVGSLREEFDLLGASFDDRGARADESLVALRSSLGRRQPSFAGDYYAYGDMVVDPCATTPDVPLWVGGRTRRSLRRAVELADGWVPFGLSVEETTDAITRARDTEAWSARRTPPDIVLTPEPPLDPGGDPARSAGAVRALLDAGATLLNVRLIHHSPAHYVEQLEALVDLDIGTG